MSVPQPVAEGAVIEVTMPDNATVGARVLSCTKEWPYIALAKTSQAVAQAVPQAAPVYVSAPTVAAPALRVSQPSKKGDDRFSLQAGAFYPLYGQIGSGTYLDYWQSYRLNYSFLKLGKVDAQLSAEYMNGFASTGSGDNKTARSMQVIPITLMGKVKPFRMGSWQLFMGAGAGFYGMRSEDTLNGVTTKTHGGALGHELSAGLEARGWMLEARYRNVPNTEIRGYSLALGTRF